jgi:hypothetical protein
MALEINRKLSKALGGKTMKDISEGDARPGEWKQMLNALPDESGMNKHNHVPALIQDKIVEEVADGATARDLEGKYELRDGYVRDVLIRRFGSIEGMKRALKAQCFENAIALNAYAVSRIHTLTARDALMGAKIMIDGGLALDKAMGERPVTVDFEALAALGAVLGRVEKRLTGDQVHEVSPDGGGSL